MAMEVHALFIKTWFQVLPLDVRILIEVDISYNTWQNKLLCMVENVPYGISLLG